MNRLDKLLDDADTLDVTSTHSNTVINSWTLHKGLLGNDILVTKDLRFKIVEFHGSYDCYPYEEIFPEGPLASFKSLEEAKEYFNDK